MEDVRLERRLALAAALRSGEFHQTDGALRVRLPYMVDQREGYCCLGVACELFRRETGQGEWVYGGEDGRGTYEFVVDDRHRSSSVLPGPVRRWLGLWSSAGATKTTFPLAEMNDRGDSFETIAGVIEDGQVHVDEDAETD